MELRDPILTECAELHDSIMADEECVLAMNEHGEFGTGLVKAVANYYKEQIQKASMHEHMQPEDLCLLKLHVNGRDVKIRAMNNTLGEACIRLTDISVRRLRSSRDGGAIGNNGKKALREDNEEIRDTIKPYAEFDELRG